MNSPAHSPTFTPASITRVSKRHARRNLKRHAANTAHRPVCGGGYGGKQNTAWQTDLGEVNCKKCLKLLKSNETETQS